MTTSALTIGNMYKFISDADGSVGKTLWRSYDKDAADDFDWINVEEVFQLIEVYHEQRLFCGRTELFTWLKVLCCFRLGWVAFANSKLSLVQPVTNEE